MIFRETLFKRVKSRSADDQTLIAEEIGKRHFKMLKTATQVMIMSCMQPFNLGRRKPWRWPWTTAARLKQNNTTTTGEKKKVFVFLEFSHLAFSSQGNKSCASLGQLITPAHSYDMLLYKIQMLCPFLFLPRDSNTAGDSRQAVT